MRLCGFLSFISYRVLELSLWEYFDILAVTTANDNIIASVKTIILATSP